MQKGRVVSVAGHQGHCTGFHPLRRSAGLAALVLAAADDGYTRVVFTSHRLEQSLQGQVKAGAQGIIARHLLVTVNTLILALLLAGGWMFEPQTDYRDMSWQATAVYAAQQALVEKLVRQGLEMLTNTWGKLAGWLLFFSGPVSPCGHGPYAAGALIQKTDLDRIMHKGCHLG